MELSRGKRLRKDIETLIVDVIGFNNMIWIVTVIMVVGFITGIVLGLSHVNS